MLRTRKVWLLLWVACLALLPAGARAAEAPKFPQEIWMGVYALGMKIGYLHTLVEEGEFGTTPGYRIKSEMLARMAMMGKVSEMREVTTQWTDREWRPLYEESDWKSDNRPMRCVARFSRTAIQARLWDGVKLTQKTIPLKPGDDLRVDTDGPLPGEPPAIGSKRIFKSFDHTNLSLNTIETEVLRREKVDVNGQQVDAIVEKSSIRVASPNTGGAGPLKNGPAAVTTITWEDQQGEPLKAQMLFMTMVREPREKAMTEPSPVYDPRRDLMKALSVKAKAPFKDPCKAKRMVVRFSGIENKDVILSDERQKADAVQNGNAWDVTYTIKADASFGDQTLTLPLKNVPAEAEPFLQATPLLPKDDPAIKAAAARALGGETNAVRASQKLHDYVFSIMKPRDPGVLRTAAAILKNKEGVCRDYALLYTALARSAGIPTRICVGVLYADDAFYYHAWAESWLGKWVPVDATLPYTLVDATHVKFGQGDTDAFMSAVSLIGQVKAEILEGE